jgi:hypothetical protein
MQRELTTWERYRNGSPEAEQVVFERLAKDIMRVQARLKAKSGALQLARTFHAKPLLAVTNARFEVADDLSEALQVGFFRLGAHYGATVRFSNASGMHQPDAKRDLRGLAVRVAVADNEVHDLLMTNFPVSHARDAEQFVAFARAMSGNRVLGIVKLVFSIGPIETMRMLRNVLTGAKRPVTSIVLESFWSRGAILWGPAGPVRYFIRPVRNAAQTGTASETSDPDYLRKELADRLAESDVAYEFCIQRFVNETQTPVEDTAVEWTESVAPPVVVARLVIPSQDVFSAEAEAMAREVEQAAFNPWRTTDDFRPLGNLNRARKMVYHASASHRLGHRFLNEPPMRNRIATMVTMAVFKVLNRMVEWHRLPLLLSLPNLSMFRHELRRKNLIDTEPPEAPPVADPTLDRIPEKAYTQRSFNGTDNDLSVPRMGAVGATFGRNLPPDYQPGQLNTPNPVTVSRQLLYREQFIPATSLNVLAAAWIQFQVHDWVQHSRYPLGKKDIQVPMPDGRTWRNVKDGPEEPVMRIAGDRPRIEPDPTTGRPPLLFANRVSHWWDASEVYGSDEQTAYSLLDGPMLRLDSGYLPENVKGAEITGFNESWWLGLSAMHTLFAREHNVVCDALRREYRDWNNMRVFHTARLVISALIAKIHTVEWTPAILATEAIDVGLNTNWYGASKNPLTQFGLWLADVHALKGIPETTPDHHGVPYSLTEDFITVYRMHPLLPDDYRFYSAADGRFLESLSLPQLQGIATDEVLRRLGLDTVLYSFGITHPGAITLHNYPHALRAFERENGEVIDLSVVDLMRERTRGIPRYNKFREGLHRPPVRRWEDLTANSESVRRLRNIYKSIDDVDTMVGLFAETPPPGFGFSDTAFRIFILMATRRLQSDRFLNVDFRPEIYSPLGIDWVQNNGMTSVILRHFPESAAMLPRTQSAFAPWRAFPLGG